VRRAYSVLTVVVTGGGVLAAAAAFLVHQEFFRERFIFNVQQAAHVLLFAALTWAAYFVGALITRRVFRQRERYWEVDLAVGWFAFGGAAFILAATGLLYAWVVRVIVLALLTLSAPTLWRLARGAGDYVESSWRRLSPAVVLLGVAAVPFAATLASGAGHPPFEWDVLVYHLYIPKLFLTNHGFVYAPRLAYVSMPLGAEMMYTWAYAWDGIGVAAAVAPLVNALMVAAVWRLARRYLDNFWATVAALITLFTPTFGYIFSAAYTDFILAAYALLALAVYARGLKRFGDAALGGLLLGAALSVKYTGLHALAGFAAVLVFDSARRRLGAKHAATFLLAALATVLPWLIKAYLERGNPFFPALYGVFGGRDLSPKVAAGIVRSMRAVGMGRGWLDYLLLPYRVSVAGGGGYHLFGGNLWPLSFLAVPLALAWFRRWRVILFSVFSFASWALVGSQQLRFLGATIGTFAVLNAGVFAAAVAAFRGSGRKIATALIAGAVVVGGYFISFGYLPDYWRGFIDYQEVRAEGFLSRWATCYAADKFVNENLPEDAVLLLVFDDCQLYLERRAICDPFLDASDIVYNVGELKDPGEVAAYVRNLGATNVMTNKRGAAYFWGYYDGRTRFLWEAYLREYTTVIYDDGTYEVRALE
jgi:hypothetical protein